MIFGRIVTYQTIGFTGKTGGIVSTDADYLEELCVGARQSAALLHTKERSVCGAESPWLKLMC